MPQDSSFEWKSEFQFKFLDENPCTYSVLGALCDTIRFFFDPVPSSDKTKGLKSIGYYDGYRDLGWCALADGSVTQGSLCSAMTQTARVRNSPCFYFFHIFLELEFYNFRNYG